MVEEFLREYIGAFNATDGARIASLYNVPCVTVRADGSIHAFENLNVVPLGGKSVIATMDWEMRREDGSTIRRWRQSYNFVVVDGGLRILASTFHPQ